MPYSNVVKKAAKNYAAEHPEFTGFVKVGFAKHSNRDVVIIKNGKIVCNCKIMYDGDNPSYADAVYDDKYLQLLIREFNCIERNIANS